MAALVGGYPPGPALLDIAALFEASGDLLGQGIVPPCAHPGDRRAASLAEDAEVGQMRGGRGFHHAQSMNDRSTFPQFEKRLFTQGRTAIFLSDRSKKLLTFLSDR
jgi:hypothetical protein